MYMIKVITAFDSKEPLKHCSRVRKRDTQCNAEKLEKQLFNKFKASADAGPLKEAQNLVMQRQTAAKQTGILNLNWTAFHLFVENVNTCLDAMPNLVLWSTC